MKHHEPSPRDALQELERIRDELQVCIQNAQRMLRKADDLMQSIQERREERREPDRVTTAKPPPPA